MNIEPKTTPPALLLDRATVAELLDWDECIAEVGRGFAAYARGESLGSGYLHGEGVDGEFHVKGAGFREPWPHFVCKVNGNFPENRGTNGLPTSQGIIGLFDARDGRPLAVMESGIVTTRRTAAATAVAARKLARRSAGAVLIAGAGRQAGAQLEALSRVMPLGQIRIWNRHRERAEAFAQALRGRFGDRVQVAGDLAAAAQDSDVIVTCTSARGWFLGSAMVRPGTFIAAVGADGGGKQELEPELLRRARVVADLTRQAVKVGDTSFAIRAGLMAEADIHAELGQVESGLRPGRQTDEEIIVFDSTGAALQDAVAARLAYEAALRKGKGTRFGFWS